MTPQKGGLDVLVEVYQDCVNHPMHRTSFNDPNHAHYLTFSCYRNRQRDAIRRAIAYIEYNPVRRGLVREADDWPWSSARARLGDSDVPVPIDSYNG